MEGLARPIISGNFLGVNIVCLVFVQPLLYQVETLAIWGAPSSLESQETFLDFRGTGESAGRGSNYMVTWPYRILAALQLQTPCCAHKITPPDSKRTSPNMHGKSWSPNCALWNSQVLELGHMSLDSFVYDILLETQGINGTLHG